MKNKPISQILTTGHLRLKLVLLGSLMTSTIATANLDDEYFIAHQVAQSHQVSNLLKGDGKTLVDEIIAELIKTHKQKEFIKQHHEDKATSLMLNQSIAEAVSSSEFDSWLNEKIATIYMELYDVSELKQMYKDGRTRDIKGESSDKVATHLSQYIDLSLSYEQKQEHHEQLFLKELKGQTQNILDQHIKLNNKDKNDDESY